jgi:curved DNA-binding protein CbpA
MIAEEADEFLRFRTRDQRARIAAESFAEEVNGAEEVLKRFSGRTSFDEFAKRGENGFTEWTIELGVELHPTFFSEGVCEEVLDVETRAFDLVFREVAGRRLDDFEN